VTADAGMIGANALIAETGSVMLVTNEGNGDLVSTLPRLLIVIAGWEKLLPTLADAGAQLRLLARSATAQEITTYTSFIPGAAAGPQGLCVSCNACAMVCPSEIPLPRQILDVRARVVAARGLPPAKRLGLALFHYPRLFDVAARLGAVTQRPLVHNRVFLRVPL